MAQGLRVLTAFPEDPALTTVCNSTSGGSDRHTHRHNTNSYEIKTGRDDSAYLYLP